MPYKLSEISASYGVYYYPIVSSARAFNAFMEKIIPENSEYLGGVVYEDPWLAEATTVYPIVKIQRNLKIHILGVKDLRKLMNQFDLNNIPIIMAGGVWNLSEWSNWINNPDLGSIAFQFGTRPLLTKESPISDEWKKDF